MLVLIFVVYSAIFVPYRICFSAHAVGWVYKFELAESIIFIIDVLFNFNTSFQQGEHFVTARSQIAARYLSGWFWIDAPSSVPVELLDSIMEGEQGNLGLLRFLRMFRLLRLLRLLKIAEYVADIEEQYDINLTSLRIVQMLIKLIYLAHVLACFWFYIADIAGLDEDIPTWVSAYDHGSGIRAPPEVQYLYSLYWALTTLTTVGYGDILAQNNWERGYAIGALLIGALIFGYMLSSIGSLVSAMDRNAALGEDKMDAVKEYMRWRKLPLELTVRVRRYYEHFMDAKTAFDEQEILQTLTPDLRFEIVHHVIKDNLHKLPLIKVLDRNAQVDFFMRLKPVSFAAKQVIYERNARPDCLYFLLKGHIEATSSFDGRMLYRIRQRQYFGEEVLTGRPRATTHRALTSCQLYVLPTEDLSDFFAHSLDAPAALKFHRVLLREHLRKTKLRGVALRMVVLQLRQVARDQDFDHLEREYAMEHMSAMRFQLSWQRHCDRVAYNSMPNFDEPKETSVSEKIQMHVVKPPSLRPATHGGATNKHDKQYGSREASPTLQYRRATASPEAAPPAVDASMVQALHTDVKRLLEVMSSMGTVERQLISPAPSSASVAAPPRSPRCASYLQDATTTSATAAAPNFFPNYRTASGQAEDAPTAASPDYTSTSPRQYMARIANERAGYLSERAAYQNRR